MKGVINLIRQKPVRLNRFHDIRRLQGDLYIVKTEPLKDGNVSQGALHHRLRGGMTMLLKDILLKGARIDTDPYRYPRITGSTHHLPYPLLRADVARI